MQHGVFITGTDTDVGKTVASAWATLHLDGDYWKPLQCGDLDAGGDCQRVKQITEFPADRFHKSTYELAEPLSPHEAARREGRAIDMKAFKLPPTNRPLIVEGAGGLMVPLTKNQLVIDLIAQLGLPVLLVARSQLGTINHTLLSLEALRIRQLPIAGMIINGPLAPHNRQALEEYGNAPVIAEIDQLEQVTKQALLAIHPERSLQHLHMAA